MNDWSSRARAGHLENISLERRGPFVGAEVVVVVGRDGWMDG